MADEPEEPTPSPDSPDTGDSTPPPDLSKPEPDPEPAPAAAPAESPEPAESSEAESPDISAGPVAVGQGKLSESEDKTFGMLAHLLGALTSFVGPLIIWLVKKEESPFVDDQGKEALNFQITIAIGYAISFVVAMIPFVQCISGLIIPALALLSLIFGIIGCVEANKGTVYRYPFKLPLVT